MTNKHPLPNLPTPREEARHKGRELEEATDVRSDKSTDIGSRLVVTTALGGVSNGVTAHGWGLLE
jgi:hypothetical protein